MICSRCGANCNDGSTICTNCGNNLQVAPTNNVPIQDISQQTMQQPVQQSNDGKKKFDKNLFSIWYYCYCWINCIFCI